MVAQERSKAGEGADGAGRLLAQVLAVDISRASLACATCMAALRDFAVWSAFEQAHPDFFAEMYTIWVMH